MPAHHAGQKNAPLALSSQHLPQPLADKNQPRTLSIGLASLPSEAKTARLPYPKGISTSVCIQHSCAWIQPHLIPTLNTLNPDATNNCLWGQLGQRTPWRASREADRLLAAFLHTEGIQALDLPLQQISLTPSHWAEVKPQHGSFWWEHGQSPIQTRLTLERSLLSDGSCSGLSRGEGCLS